jgi:hypothetical protein
LGITETIDLMMSYVLSFVLYVYFPSRFLRVPVPRANLTSAL